MKADNLMEQELTSEDFEEGLEEPTDRRCMFLAMSQFFLRNSEVELAEAREDVYGS